MPGPALLPPAGGSHYSSMLAGTVAWLSLFGMYLLFAGEVSVGEAVAGAPTAALVAAFAIKWRRIGTRQFHLVAPWPRLVIRIATSLITDTARVGLVLAQALRRRPTGEAGAMALQPFQFGEAQPTAAARRALVTLGVSMAPNGFLLDMPPEQNALLLHRLVPVPAQPNRCWPL